ncbi:hypothetical protein [Streptomyces beihaiensis]|uniref:Holin n=1 Tax=Streptomyces beihaiensis TaxID=2984495 RepID=A0ABT3U4D6_9ACTN|nr:hypothetical protein [Streptomyces beihaiensis]MCX3064192.1 hypothetical protein [Streptomyces beihaiensis]
MTNDTKRTIRTAVQFLVGLAAALPLLVHASGIPETAPGVGVGLAVAAAVTRLMAMPVVQRLLPGWLRTDEESTG